MCGSQVTDRPRGGALAALAAAGGDSPCRGSLEGDLAFHTPGQPGSSLATHARFTPSGRLCLENLDGLRVVIHSIGDMTKAAGDCGLFRQFTFRDARSQAPYVEVPLEVPLELQVGGVGIIGRRVSVSRRTASGTEDLVGEGIVGFNFLELP